MRKINFEGGLFMNKIMEYKTIILLTLLTFFVFGCALSPEERAVSAAKTLIAEYLKAPSTAKYQSTKIIEQNGQYYLIHVIVDAQNSFGAMIRGNYLVCIELTEGNRFKFNPNFAVQECSNPPDEMIISVVKKLNEWPEIKTSSSDAFGGSITEIKQREAKQILKQIYVMERAYWQENRTYTCNGESQSAGGSFATLGVDIMSTARYTYHITADKNSFTATAKANLDDDDTIDIWEINEKGELICIINDATS